MLLHVVGLDSLVDEHSLCDLVASQTDEGDEDERNPLPKCSDGEGDDGLPISGFCSEHHHRVVDHDPLPNSLELEFAEGRYAPVMVGVVGDDEFFLLVDVDVVWSIVRAAVIFGIRIGVDGDVDGICLGRGDDGRGGESIGGNPPPPFAK